MRLRILHFLILGCIALLGAKVADFFIRDESLTEALFISNTSAQEEKKSEDENDKKAQGEEGKDSEEKKDKKETGEEVDKEEEKNKEENKEGNKEGEEEKDKDKKDEKETDEEAAKEEEGAPVDITKELTFTETEVEILKRLQQRREKLDQWEETLKVKDNVLRVTQTKIDQKLTELRDLKQEVEKLLAEYSEKDDAKIRSLVKIYESMKPKDAAEIFENLDMEILLMVIDKMKEAKSALILAKMSPEKSKQLTVLFAEQRRLAQAREAKNKD